MARKNVNPFACQGYIGPEYFCDRENETKMLAKTLYNGRNVTLISPRRLGKTGLILHTFAQIKAKNRDAGYAGMEDVVRAKHMTPIICEKGRRGHPLTDEQKERNRQKSKVRSRVEHVFGFMKQTMGGLVFRGVVMIRAKANIAMTNLVYNMCRLVQIKKYQPNLVTIQ